MSPAITPCLVASDAWRQLIMFGWVCRGGVFVIRSLGDRSGTTSHCLGPAVPRSRPLAPSGPRAAWRAHRAVCFVVRWPDLTCLCVATVARWCVVTCPVLSFTLRGVMFTWELSALDTLGAANGVTVV